MSHDVTGPSEGLDYVDFDSLDYRLYIPRIPPPFVGVLLFFQLLLRRWNSDRDPQQKREQVCARSISEQQQTRQRYEDCMALRGHASGAAAADCNDGRCVCSMLLVMSLRGIV